MKRRGNGEGTLFKRKDGRWSAQLYVAASNGGKKRICITLKSREAVKNKVHELLEQGKHQMPCQEKDWTVEEYLDYWMQDIQSTRVRDYTIAAYTVLIKCHIKPTLGGCKLRALSVQDLRRALEELRKRGASERTRRECLRVLSSCLNCAMREEIIQRNVTQLVEKPKHISQKPLIWSAEQAAFFLEEIKDHPYYIAFLLFLTYGLRRGEVLGLRWSDIDIENKLIHVRQQIGRVNGSLKAWDLKTQNSYRSLPLMSNVLAALLEHAKKNNIDLPQFNPHFEISTKGTVITSKVGTPLEPRRLARYFVDLIEKTGLPQITLHAMRHTAATILKDLNVPVKDAQLILGHSDIATTLNIYQHGTPENHRTAISAVEGLLLTKMKNVEKRQQFRQQLLQKAS